ncbi:MAG: hypothetical protein ACJ71W_18855 [Terriglobales bacterium]
MPKSPKLPKVKIERQKPLPLIYADERGSEPAKTFTTEDTENTKIDCQNRRNCQPVKIERQKTFTADLRG